LRFKEFEGEWVEATLGEIANVSKLAGYEFTKHITYEESGKIIALRGLNIKSNKLDLSDVKYIDNSDLSKLNRSKLFIDDLMFTYIGTIGEVALIEENDRFYLAPNVSRIRVDKKIILPQFLLQYFNLPRFKNIEIQKYVSSSSQPALTMENVRKFAIIFPTFQEQTKIATFLSLLDDRISTQRQIIEEMKSLKDATNNKLIYENKLLNQKMRLSDIGEVKNGYAFKSKSYEERGKYKVITIANVTGERNISALKCNNIIDLPKDIQPHQTLKLNDILISLTGNVGRVSLCNIDNALLNQRVGLFVPNNIMNTEYIFQSISNKRFEKMMIASGKGAAQMNINKSDIENYEIPYSSDKVQLLKISSLLRKLDQKIETEQKLLSAYQNQKKYVLSQLFI
jgi:type I restriction enzyme S subunit